MIQLILAYLDYMFYNKATILINRIYIIEGVIALIRNRKGIVSN